MPQNNTSSSSLLGRLTTSTRSSFMSPKDVRCNVHLLHDSDIVGNEFSRTKSAQTVLDYVCELKHIQEKDFLGLRYQDHHKHRYWLDLTRSIGHVVKQFKIPAESMILHLRFRYYPSEPARLRDPNLRYQLFVQLQRDLLHGRLYCPTTCAAELAALILQTNLGDFDEEKHKGNYVSEYRLLLKQTPKIEERVAVLHKEMKGKSSTDAELEFLEKASQLDTYAFDPYTIKDPHDPVNPVYFGASCKGILIYSNQSRVHHIDWADVAKIDYSGKEIKVTLADSWKGSPGGPGTPTGTLNGHVPGGSPISGTSNMDKYQPKKPVTLKYICPSGQFAKHLWIHVLSQQAFFNETSAQDVKLKFSKPRIPLLSRGSTFRFPSKRVYREIEEDDGRSLHFDRSVLDTSVNLNETMTSNEMEESVLNCSSISVPTSSAPSVVVRYELPRQTPRAEQIWLNKAKHANGGPPHFETTDPGASPSTSNTDNHNNNQPKLSNLNVSFEDPLASSPISLSPLSEEVKIVHTQQQHADQNSTSFTVHLIKRETVSSSTSSSESATSSGASTRPRRQPSPSSSTTRAQVLERRFQEIVEQDVDFGRPLASSTPRTTKQLTFEQNGNGKLANGGGTVASESKNSHNHTNGHTLCTEEKQESLISETEDTSVGSKPTKSALARVTNTLFVLFLTLLLLVAIVIVVFEKSEGSAHNDFIESHVALSELRHAYYEPARHYVVDQYRKYFGAKI